MCKLLEVSRSGYFAWLKKPKMGDKDAETRESIFNIYYNHKGRYGSRRIRYAMLKEGTRVNRKKVQRLMREMNLCGKSSYKQKKTTNSKHKKQISANLIEGKFNPITCNKLWVSDITYIQTKEGWLYLCVIIDCFGRRVVSWSLKQLMTKELVTEALNEALKKEKPNDLIFHSDRGVQYTSNELRAMLAKHKVRQSMSGKGNCYDNAVAESFFKTLKTELNKRRFASRAEADLEIFKYLETYYNQKRMHSANNYLTPNEMYLNAKMVG